MNSTKSESAQLARIRVGEETDPVEPGVWMSPGQLWHFLLEAHPAERLSRLDLMIQNAQKAEQCFVQDHINRIAWLERSDG